LRLGQTEATTPGLDELVGSEQLSGMRLREELLPCYAVVGGVLYGAVVEVVASRRLLGS